MLGYLLDLAHRGFQASARILWPEPIRYAIAKRRMLQVMRPIDREIEKAKRLHRPVAHLYAAKKALVEHGLKGAAR
ncbi:hypothetical protein [Brevundimonas aurantiaca]|uniref:hypothetical protein n=1 Tax=Brevundimonas aurantiaca TaxID=74316 RepID=UPI001D18E93A|nr:hypothetical protein [Brevundimonas aurantiaca]MCC4295831.1 hypothetical protein [Brevundimonas aurantiaca]